MGSATGPANWQVLVDPGTGWVEIGSGATGAASIWVTPPLDLSTFGPYAGVVAFRITATGASASAGTWRLDNVDLVGLVDPL